MADPLKFFELEEVKSKTEITSKEIIFLMDKYGFSKGRVDYYYLISLFCGGHLLVEKTKGIYTINHKRAKEELKSTEIKYAERGSDADR